MGWAKEERAEAIGAAKGGGGGRRGGGGGERGGGGGGSLRTTEGIWGSQPRGDKQLGNVRLITGDEGHRI